MRLCLSILSLLPSFLYQPAPPSPDAAFEVASVRPSKQAGPFSMSPRPGGKFSARNIPLHLLIEAAYRVESYDLLGGPANLLDEKYDIDASAGRSITNAELGEMVRTLVKDRFRLRIHQETRSSSVYTLTVAKGGVKLKPFLGEVTPELRPGIRNVGTKMTGVAARMSWLTENLGRALAAPVIDKTGLSGQYDFVLEWSRDPLSTPAGRPPEPDSPLPPLPIAIEQQLGINLVSEKGTKTVYVIDHVERASEN